MSQKENIRPKDIKDNSERSDLEFIKNSEEEFVAKEGDHNQPLGFGGILLTKLKELYIQNFGHIENPEFCRKKLCIVYYLIF